MSTKFKNENNKENFGGGEIDLKKIREIASRNKNMMHEQMEADYTKEEKAIEKKKRRMQKHYTKSKSEKKLALIKKLKIDIGPGLNKKRDERISSNSSSGSHSDDGSEGDSAYLDDISLNTIQEIYTGVRP